MLSEKRRLLAITCAIWASTLAAPIEAIGPGAAAGGGALGLLGDAQGFLRDLFLLRRGARQRRSRHGRRSRSGENGLFHERWIVRELLPQVQPLVDRPDSNPDVRLHVVGDEVERRLARQLPVVEHLVEDHRDEADLPARIGLQAARGGARDAIFADLPLDEAEGGQLSRRSVLRDLHFGRPEIADRLSLLVPDHDVQQDDGAGRPVYGPAGSRLLTRVCVTGGVEAIPSATGGCCAPAETMQTRRPPCLR